MGEKTGISWTDHTWNPFIGCSKVSAGCKNCYFFRDAERYGFDPGVVRRASKANFKRPLLWRDPARVFACSWSDFFHDAVDPVWRAEAWEIIRQTPHLTYQILTKRPQNIKDALPEDWGNGWPNVWLGVTVEDLDNVWRLEALAGILAVLRFASYEPALSYLGDAPTTYAPVVKWWIAGGESGPGARLPNMYWITNVLSQCQEAEIPFFFKQNGGARKVDRVWGGDVLDGKRYHEFPTI